MIKKRKFSTFEEAMFFLADLTGSSIKIAKENAVMNEMKIPDGLQSKINKSLNKYGLDGNKKYTQMSEALNDIKEVLKKYSIEFGELVTYDKFIGKNGQKLVLIAQTNLNSLDEPMLIGNSSLYIQWSPFGDSKDLSVVAYLL